MSEAPTPALGGIHRSERMPIVALLGLSLALLLAGIFRPFTRVTKLWFFDSDVSVYRGLITLFQEREIFLFGILIVFTVIFPFVKIIALLVLWLSPGLDAQQMSRVHGFVAHLSKWSMLDVFIVAVLVVLIRAGGLATIKAQDGLLLFCASVVLTQIASEWTGRIAKRTFASPAPG
jgi:paraquat-inducible protein A